MLFKSVFTFIWQENSLTCVNNVRIYFAALLSQPPLQLELHFLTYCRFAQRGFRSQLALYMGSLSLEDDLS